MPIPAAIPIGAAVLQGIGGIFGASAASKAAKAQTRLQRRALGTQEGVLATGLQQNIDTLPLRDRAAFMLMSRFGALPGGFRPDAFSTNATPHGADEADAMSAAGQAYTPGAGGMTSRVQEDLLRRLGYGPEQANAPQLPNDANLIDRIRHQQAMKAFRRQNPAPLLPG